MFLEEFKLTTRGRGGKQFV